MLEVVNDKLKKYGLEVSEIDYLGYYIKDIKIDLINEKDYYKFFMKVYNDLDLSVEIKEHEDFQDYNYTLEEFIIEELENSFNEPYLISNRINDISILNNDLIGEVNIKVCNHLNKDFSINNPNPIKVVFMG